jgi:hypothetical protein
MVRLLRLKAPLRGGHSGCPTAKSGGFAGLLRVSRPLRVPKNFWAGVTRHVRDVAYGCAIIQRVTFPHIFSYPACPEQSSIYAGFSKSTYPEHLPSHSEYPEHFCIFGNFMVRNLT